MPKTRLSFVAEYQKCQKVAGPRSRKNAKKSQVRGYKKIRKMLRSAFMQKCLKLACPLSRNDIKNAKKSQVRGYVKMPKRCRSAVREICKNLQVRGQEKIQKGAGMLSQKNAIKSKVCSHGKIQKCLVQQLFKND